MNALEFEVAFYEAMAKWAAGGKVGPDPRGEIEYRPNTSYNWWRAHAPLLDSADGEYRWKPTPKRTVVIDGVELVAPEVVAPTIGTMLFSEGPDGTVMKLEWSAENFDNNALANGKLFLTHEDAQAMSDTQRKQRLGVRHEHTR